MKVFRLLLCIVVGTMLYSCSSSSSSDVEYDYLPVRESKGGNWGFVGTDGKVIHSEEFKNQPTVVFNGFFSVDENGGYSLYKMGDKLTVVDGCEDLYSVGAVNEGLVPVTKRGERITIVNEKGKVQFTLNPINGEEIIACSSYFENGLLKVQNQQGYYGVVDRKGNVVINPEYKEMYNFSEGKCVVKKDKESPLMVINTKGETLFEMKEDYYLTSENECYKNGLIPIIVVNGNASDARTVFLDEKGEVKYKCPSKVARVNEYNSKYIVYHADGGDYGVMDFEMEVLIRAKYRHMEMLSDGNFLCEHNNKYYIKNKKDEELCQMDDYYSVDVVGKSFIVAQERNDCLLLDKDWKPIKNAEFYSIGDKLSHSDWVNTDFFDAERVASSLADMITDNGVGSYEIGENPSAHFSDPSRNTYTQKKSLEDLGSAGFRFTISATGQFSERMAVGSYDSSLHKYVYEWNEDAKLQVIEVFLRTKGDWTQTGHALLDKALEDKGCKKITSSQIGTSEVVSAFKKGNVIVIQDSDQKGCNITVYKYSSEEEDNVKNLIVELGSE